MLKYYSHRPMPIEAYVGMNGSGKTALAVQNAIKMSRGRTLYTTTPIKTDEAEVVMITSLKQFEDMKNGHVFLDEVNSVFPSRGTQTLPHEFSLLLSALRHYDLTMSYTTPSYDHAEIQLRRVTQTATACKSLFRRPVKGSMWPRTLLSYVNQYDMRAYVEDEIGLATPVVSRGFLWLPWLSLDAYNTNAHVAMIADHLVCPDCGGAIKKQYCSGHPAPVKTKPIKEVVDNLVKAEEVKKEVKQLTLVK